MGGEPKQYRRLSGHPVIAHSFRSLRDHPAIDEVLVVIGAGQKQMLTDAVGPVRFVTGGATRRESVLNGLEWVSANGGADRVLIHDAARPFLPPDVIDRLIAALDRSPGAIPTLRIVDTLVEQEPINGQDGVELEVGDTVDRSAFLRVQTPQAFAFGPILAAHRAWPTQEEATDDAQVLRRAGLRVTAVRGDPMLEKLTHPDDFTAAERRSGSAMISRSATGFDVHRLETGQELWLGGVLIPHDKGLSGHSDADVALHALTDALLGTIGAGDIGTHFPPSDPQWKGAASDQFLTHAVDMIAAGSGVIDFADLTLICEAPKIGRHRVAMRDRIAELLRIPASRVSIKATTTERLGFAGRGEGIAAQAIATVRMPEGE